MAEGNGGPYVTLAETRWIDRRALFRQHAVNLALDIRSGVPRMGVRDVFPLTARFPGIDKVILNFH